MVAKEEKASLIGQNGLKRRGQNNKYGSISSVDKIKEDEIDSTSQSKSSTSRCECVFIVMVITLALLGIIIGEATLIPIALDKIEKTKNCLISVDPGVFPEAAVATDDYRCSMIARDILLRGGSAVDATIGAQLCIGVVVPHSAGLGGGNFMTIYDKVKGQTYVLNSREKAPENADSTMFDLDPNLSVEGGLAVGVPGEVKGMWMSHQKFGRLPWKSLFEESIKLCRDGALVSPALAASLEGNKDIMKSNQAFRNIFWNSNTSNVHKEGDVIRRPRLADTLETISNNGPEAFYSGKIADALVRDIQNAGGIMTETDLEEYDSEWVDPIKADIDGIMAVGPPVPSSTSLSLFILNVMKRYKLTPKDIEDTDSSVLMYHRLIESFKYGYSMSSDLADPHFADISGIESKLMSEEYAEEVRNLINDEKTFDPKHYDIENRPQRDHGTSHISILAPDGSAVALTTSINLHFGAKLMSVSTGIILNNEMDDFTKGNHSNSFGLSLSPNNNIAPGKQPLSSMMPIIMLNTTTGNVTAIIGAAGGSKIPTAVTQVAILKTWLGKKTHTAVSEPRIHHQLIPNVVEHEIDFSKAILEGLAKKGHKLKTITKKVSTAVNVIFHTDRCIRASSDPRKGGQSAAVGF